MKLTTKGHWKKFDTSTARICFGFGLPILALTMFTYKPKVASRLPVDNYVAKTIDSVQSVAPSAVVTEHAELVSDVQIQDLANHDRAAKRRKAVVYARKRVEDTKQAVSNIRQLKTTFHSRRIGWDLPRDKQGVVAWMASQGYRGDYAKLSLPLLRRVIYAYEYDALYWGVHEKTGIAVSMIYAYFIIESVRPDGRESTLFRDNGNPGGIKAKKGQKQAKYFDDCFNSKGQKIKCSFAVYETEREIIDAWAGVFNNGRYDTAKSGKNTDEIAKRIYKGGYHTAKNWQVRADVADTYWKYRQYFPDVR